MHLYWFPLWRKGIQFWRSHLWIWIHFHWRWYLTEWSIPSSRLRDILTMSSKVSKFFDSLLLWASSQSLSEHTFPPFAEFMSVNWFPAALISCGPKNIELYAGCFIFWHKLIDSFSPFSISSSLDSPSWLSTSVRFPAGDLSIFIPADRLLILNLWSYESLF